jgi:hypothetical protein
MMPSDENDISRAIPKRANLYWDLIVGGSLGMAIMLSARAAWTAIAGSATPLSRGIMNGAIGGVFGAFLARDRASAKENADLAIDKVQLQDKIDQLGGKQYYTQQILNEKGRNHLPPLP